MWFMGNHLGQAPGTRARARALTHTLKRPTEPPPRPHPCTGLPRLSSSGLFFCAHPKAFGKRRGPHRLAPFLEPAEDGAFPSARSRRIRCSLALSVSNIPPRGLSLEA